MTVMHRLRTLMCCAILEVGTLLGVPMRPEQIRDLLQTLKQPKVAQTDPEETAGGDCGPCDATPRARTESAN